MEKFLSDYSTFLNIFVWVISKDSTYEILIPDMKIVRRVSLEVIDFWEIPSIPKIREPFDTFIELISVFIFDAEIKVEISDILVLFNEVILLGLRYMVDLMPEDDLFCKLEVYYFNFFEFLRRTSFQTCLKCWGYLYLVIWTLSLRTKQLLICIPFSPVHEQEPQ